MKFNVGKQPSFIYNFEYEREMGFCSIVRKIEHLREWDSQIVEKNEIDKWKGEPTFVFWVWFLVETFDTPEEEESDEWPKKLFKQTAVEATIFASAVQLLVGS